MNLEEKYNKRSDFLETKFEDRFKQIEKILTETAKSSDLEDIEQIVNNLEKKDKVSDKAKQQFEDRFKKIECVLNKTASDSDLNTVFQRLYTLEDAEKHRETNAIMQESYEKRFNILFHGLEENSNSAWETRDETLKILQNFMKEGLNIANPSQITLADYHRLPQQPTYKNKVKINRPIIIKVTNVSDKNLIFSNLKNLKAHNDRRRLQSLRSQYVTEHLPKLFQEERKSLLPAFKEARSQNKKTTWRAEKGHYNLYIDGKKFDL